MIKTLKTMILTVFSATALLMPLAPATAGAVTTGPVNIGENLCAGADIDINASNCSTSNNAEDKVNGILRLVINLFSIIVGVIAVIMIIIGGVKYITSGGNDTNVASAKSTILYAVIGLVVVALAQILVRFVLQKVSSV